MRTIEVYSDVACPWCYLGKRRFERVLASFPVERRPEVRWRAFQLRPDYPMGQSELARPLLENLFGGAARFDASFEHLQRVGAPEQINFNLDAQIACNTRLAHRGIAFASGRGLASAAAESFFAAYFSEGQNLSEPKVIASCLQRAGIEMATDRLCQALEAPDLDTSVENDLLRAARFGVRSVPFFVANEAFALPGADGEDAFRALIEQAISSNAP